MQKKGPTAGDARLRSEGDRMTDFNFLRIKWPKLAAIAADAGRLVEVSPSSAISTMHNFCEWAADIALDFYDIDTQNGITQQEKLDTLKATGHVPADILNRFHEIMMAGGRHLYRANEDVEEARQCLEDIYEIGRWLNKEADRAGWPPKNDYYRPVMSSMGMPGESSGGGGFSSGRAAKAFNAYKPLILMIGGTLAVIIAAIFIIKGLVSDNVNATPTGGISVTPTWTVESTPALSPTLDPNITPTPPPETVVYLDSLTPKKTERSFFLKKWDFQSGEHSFKIADKVYQNGIGMYIPKSSITRTQATLSMSFSLEGKYDKLRFDLGVDSMLQYGEGYGKFRVMIYCDSTSNDPVYDSGLKEYTFTDMGREISIKGCNTLYIKLTEVKGSKGTINVVLGDIRVVSGGTAGETEATQPAGTATADASATSSAGTPASASAEGTPEASASATATAGEQQPPG